MRKLHFAWVNIMLLTLVASCQSEDLDPFSSSSAQYLQNESEIAAYATKNSLSLQKTNNGLHYQITVQNPDGKKPQIGEELEFNYKLYNLKDTTVLDGTKEDSAVYYQFGLGALKLGLEQGISLMREGEQAILLMPFTLAFGDQAVSNQLPAYSPVRFDVHLLRSRSEDEQIDDYIKRNKLTNVEKTASGLRFIKTKENPTGAVPANGQTLTVSYSGKLLRATSSFEGGSGVGVKTVGRTEYVQGFEEGLARLKVGERATLIFPSALGYSSQGRAVNRVYVIPPYSPLAFDIEVVSAK